MYRVPENVPGVKSLLWEIALCAHWLATLVIQTKHSFEALLLLLKGAMMHQQQQKKERQTGRCGSSALTDAKCDWEGVTKAFGCCGIFASLVLCLTLTAAQSNVSQFALRYKTHDKQRANRSLKADLCSNSIFQWVRWVTSLCGDCCSTCFSFPVGGSLKLTPCDIRSERGGEVIPWWLGCDSHRAALCRCRHPRHWTESAARPGEFCRHRRHGSQFRDDFPVLSLDVVAKCRMLQDSRVRF